MNQDTEILVFDVETTGINTELDQIIEIAIKFGLKDDSLLKSWRVKPSIPIPPSSTEIHGISDKDVENCPTFFQISSEIKKIFENAKIIIGYNVMFDIKMLQSEFRRAKTENMTFDDKLIIDPMLIWKRIEPRNLGAAAKRFAGLNHDDAHNAGADVNITAKVLKGMQKEFNLSNLSWEELDNFTNPGKKNWLGPSSHFLWEKDDIVVGFGKHKGTSLNRLLDSNRDYLEWITNTNFPNHVKMIANKALTKTDKEFNEWVNKEFIRESQ